MKWLYKYVVPGCLGILAGWVLFSLKHEEAWSRHRMALLHWHWGSAPVVKSELPKKKESEAPKPSPVKKIGSTKKAKTKPHRRQQTVSQAKVHAQKRKPASVRAKIDKAPEIKSITIEE